jgi:hypothetical protein
LGSSKNWKKSKKGTGMYSDDSKIYKILKNNVSIPRIIIFERFNFFKKIQIPNSKNIMIFLKEINSFRIQKKK